MYYNEQLCGAHVVETGEKCGRNKEAITNIIFHSNILHRSEANLSDYPRWSLISCYNRSSNIPYNEPSGSSTIPISMVADDALMNIAKAQNNREALAKLKAAKRNNPVEYEKNKHKAICIIGCGEKAKKMNVSPTAKLGKTLQCMAKCNKTKLQRDDLN